MLFPFLFILASYACFTAYHIRAYDYCRHILAPARNERGCRAVSLAVSYLVLTFALFYPLPAPLGLMVLYFMVVLQFLYFFRDELIACIFGSGTLMFHIMNVKMIAASIFILVYRLPSYSAFRERALYLPCTFVTGLLLLISLEVFLRTMDLKMVLTLMRSRSQLRFVTSSMMLVNIYLLILSAAYNDQKLSGPVGIFLLSTSLLLFGAFYTSFWHGVKMSVMLETEHKSQLLEAQLQATREDVEELQGFAFTDTLTAVHNRRFGLDELDRLLRDRTPFCLAFLDIDHLKYVNDTFGHQEGDRYILDVVTKLSAACGKGETLSRMGGDEFMLLLPRVLRPAALERLKNVAEAISRIPSTYRPSVSYGVVEAAADEEWTASQILQKADQEMYRFKQANHAGRASATALAQREETV